MRCLRPPQQAQVLSAMSITISSRARCGGSAPRLMLRLRVVANRAGVIKELQRHRFGRRRPRGLRALRRHHPRREHHLGRASLALPPPRE
jgi:hypothetical protein